MPKTRLQMRIEPATSEEDADSTCFFPRLDSCALMEPERDKNIFFNVDLLKSNEHFSSS